MGVLLDLQILLEERVADMIRRPFAHMILLEHFVPFPSYTLLQHTLSEAPVEEHLKTVVDPAAGAVAGVYLYASVTFVAQQAGLVTGKLLCVMQDDGCHPQSSLW